jgi:hypothetical protein
MRQRSGGSTADITGDCIDQRYGRGLSTPSHDPVRPTGMLLSGPT